MRRVVTYLITIVISICIGFASFYMLVHYYPNSVIKTVNKVERSVTVTDKGISDGIDNIYDAVVVIENYKRGKLAGIGSGFIYNKNGLIMTNHHVIENASEIKVVLMDGEKIDAKVLGSDAYADIAVVRIDKKYVKSVAKIGRSEDTKLGDTVFTIGSLVSSDYAGTVTRGILSGKNRLVEVSVSSNSNDWIMNVMQTDAAINPGNSGGPLCNVSGQVIGVNSMKLVQSQIEGIGFAIPIEDAIKYAETLVKGEKIKRAYLGISMGDITSTYSLFRNGIYLDDSITGGVVVFGVETDGPSYETGLQKGDVIVKIGKYDVSKVAELRYYLFKYNPGDTVKVKVIRGKEEKTFDITLGTGN